MKQLRDTIVSIERGHGSLNPYRTRKIARIIAIIVAVVMIITSFSFVMVIPGLFGMESGYVYAATSQEDELDTQLQDLKSYMQYIKNNFKDTITLDQLVEGAYAGVMESLNDPYSVYFSATTDEGENFVQSVTGEFYGIGVSVENYNGTCRVVSPISGTPAEASGIKSGDIITKVDGVDVTSKTLDEVVSMMRGDEGTKVTLTINRSGKILSVTMTREIIKTTSVSSKVLDGHIGYIQITGFDNDSNEEFQSALADLEGKGITSLIVDERNNPGGLVSTALDIANQLMPKGPITYFEQQGKLLETYSADGTSEFDLPMVLLVNEGSASASEILAGALQDSGVATLVGTTTFGKGVAQQIIDFTDGSSMKLSQFYFLTPLKHTINHVGITPDYTVQNTTAIDVDILIETYHGFAPMSEKVKPIAGMIGLNVYGAQQRLSMLGYELDINGTMDAKTVAAVKKFQKETGLYAAGTLDYTTMNAIDNAAISYISSAGNGEDLQLEKAIELLQ